MDAVRYRDVLAHLEYQAGHAVVWRDAVCGWFRRTSGMPDAAGRVERVPGRLEAEDHPTHRLCASRRDAVGDGLARQGRGLRKR